MQQRRRHPAGITITDSKKFAFCGERVGAIGCHAPTYIENYRRLLLRRWVMGRRRRNAHMGSPETIIMLVVLAGCGGILILITLGVGNSSNMGMGIEEEEVQQQQQQEFRRRLGKFVLIGFKELVVLEKNVGIYILGLPAAFLC